MKRTNSILALVLVLVMMLALGSTAYAAAQTYSITVENTNSNISIVGNTYTAYKLFNVTYSGDAYAYTVTDEFAGFTYTVDGQSYTGEGLINYLSTLDDGSDAVNAFTAAALTYAEANLTPAGTATATGESAKISVETAGYYLIAGEAHSSADANQTVTASCALDTTNPDATVSVKADIPSIDKKIVEGANRVEANTASIGDKITYEITSKVPDMTGYTHYFFVMEDTMSKGLTFNSDVSITIGGTTLAADQYEMEAVSGADGSTTINIYFKNFIQYKEQKDADIVVTYSATLNQEANLTQAGNPNLVKLVYSNNPYVSGTGDKPGSGDAVGETPEIKVITYSTGIQVNKVDEEGNALSGAKFSVSGEKQNVVLINKTLYVESSSGEAWMLKDGSYTIDAPVTDKNLDTYNADLYDDVNQKYTKVTEILTETTAKENFTTEGYVNGSGVLTLEGLNAGTYTITELVSPSGYNLLKEPVTVTISADATLNGCTWTATMKVGDGDATDVSMTDDLVSINVVNNHGSELPSTGGIGTTIFYVLGGLLVVGAGVLLITRKRMKKDEE